MRRLTALLCTLVVFSSCQRKPSAADVAREDGSDIVSTFSMGDPAAASQMLHGFYSLEGGQWRWASGSFGVVLSPPSQASRLELHLTMPGVVLSSVGPVTLSATANGTPLEPQTFSAEGEQIYARDLPDASGPFTIEFTTDETLATNPPEERKLSFIVTKVGLLAR